jgi:subtilase family serine protease
MNRFNISSAARPRGRSIRPPRRTRRLALDCEPLQTRQLLSISVFPAAISSAGAAQPAEVEPNISLAPLASSASPTGLSPSQIKTAYGVNQIEFDGNVVGNGAGQTIAIVDAFFDPNIQSDLATFDAQYGLAAPPSFTQFVESGLRTDNSSWALETALDVEWAHAIAPAASIDLVEAQPDLTDLLSAVSFASSLRGVSVVSMSWGAGEFSGETSLDSVFTTPAGHNGVTFVASSGDSAVVEYPAASPNVLAVGGTTLNVTSNGTFVSETAWSDSGGGLSAFEPGQPFQTAALEASGIKTTARATPDVAFDANPSTGVSVFDSVGGVGWVQVGGTSVGAPSWAGLIAIADQGLALAGKNSLANAQEDLYQLPSSDFHDITSGSTPLHSAAPGFDLVTGLGSPKANLLIPALVAATGGSSVVTTTTTAHPAVSITASPRDVTTITAPSPAGGGGNTTTTTSSSSAGSNASIAPLSPVASPASIAIAPIVVTAVSPAPTVNLGPSTSPLTTQASLAVVPNQTLPATPTDRGQSPAADPGVQGQEQLEVLSQAARTDHVEPSQPAAPEVEGQPAPPPSAAQTSSLPAFSAPDFETLVDLSVADLFPTALAGSPRSGDEPEEIRPSLGLSTIFGAAVVAAGGYHLALRPSDPFRRRGIPDRTEADGSLRRRFADPAR